MTLFVDRDQSVDDMTPELRARSGEFVYGRHEPIEIYADQLVKLNQIRKDENSELELIKQSIVRRGLINQIDVVRVDDALLGDYIEFTNALWGDHSPWGSFDPWAGEQDEIVKPLSVADFAQKKIGGYYYLLCAGHTRHEAITQLEAEGRTPRGRIPGKLHHVSSVQDILDIQAEENLHSKPPIERTSYSLVQAYLWGEAHGEWMSPEEYIEARGLNQKALDMVTDALEFLNLDNAQRAFVFKKKIPYTVGIEAGMTARKLFAYYTVKLGYTEADLLKTLADFPDDSMKAEDLPIAHVQRLTTEDINIYINEAALGKLNSTSGRKKFQAIRAQLDKEMNELRQLTGKSRRKAGTMDISLELDVQAELERIESLQAKRSRAFFARLGRTPVQRATEILELNVPLQSEEVVSTALSDLEAAREEARRIYDKMAAPHQSESLF